eukprot:m.75911 g.75911  ORF g.75911 m.75911 type:complete len:57 (+) comp13152_c0_seq2:455-625(+)
MEISFIFSTSGDWMILLVSHLQKITHKVLKNNIRKLRIAKGSQAPANSLFAHSRHL